MERSRHAGPIAPAVPESPDLLYDRDVRTRVYRDGPDTLRAVCTLKDDTYSPQGFSTPHDMVLTATIAEPELTITAVDASMPGHPQRGCPATLRDLDQLVGLSIASGYLRALRERLGGDRSCNHLHTMAQSMGAVVGLCFAARVVHDDPQSQRLPHDRWFLNIVEQAPGVIGSCAVWREDAELAVRLRRLRNGEDES